MAEPTPTPTPTPPLTGVNPVQNVPTEVVTEIPEKLKSLGGLSPYPVTLVIETLRQDSNAIRGDVALLMLQSMVQGIEQKAHLTHLENNNTREKLDKAQTENTKLSVENAVLKKEVEHKDSDKDARTAFIGLGGIGIGVAVPLAIAVPSGSTIFCSILSIAVFACGLFYPKKGKANS